MGIAQPVSFLPRRLASDPLRLTRHRGDLPVQGLGDLHGHEGHPGGHLLDERLVSRRASCSSTPVVTAMPAAGWPDTAAGHAGVRVDHGHDHTLHAARDHQGRTGRSALVRVRAGSSVT